MLPSLDRLAADRNIPKPGQIRMLVLAPTRELASQIAAMAEAYGRFMRLSVGVIFGGVPNGKSVRTVARGLDVLVATPGPPARPDRPARAEPARARDPRPRRGRPDARPRLHPCAEADRRAGPGQAPDPVLLGHHAEGDQGAGRPLSDQPGRSRGDSGRQDRRPRRADASSWSTRRKRPRF